MSQPNHQPSSKENTRGQEEEGRQVLIDSRRLDLRRINLVMLEQSGIPDHSEFFSERIKPHA